MTTDRIEAQGTNLFSKVSLLFAGSMLLNGFGTLLGMPMATSVTYAIVTAIAFIVMSIVVAVAAKTAPAPAAVFLLGVFSFVSGLFLGPTIGMYVQQLGAGTVALAYLGTGGIMVVCGIVATFSGINFKPLEGILMLGLFGMIVVGLITCFTGMTVAFDLTYSIIGVVLFSAFFLVDFYRLAENKVGNWNDAVELTVQLFLDYLNVLLYALRIIAIFANKSDDD